MTRFFAMDFRDNTRIKIDFSEFISLVKGCSIISLASSDNFIELGLDGVMNMRIGLNGGGFDVGVYSTLNDGDIPPFRIEVIAKGEEPSAGLVEDRIRMLRQLHAIAFLLEENRHAELALALAHDPSVDVEASMLNEGDRLYIKAASPGSLWLTVITKSKAAYAVAWKTFSLVFTEGRGALLRRIEADTRLKELAAEEKKIDLGFKMTSGLIELHTKIEKIKDKDEREAIRRHFIENVRGISNGPPRYF